MFYNSVKDYKGWSYNIQEEGITISKGYDEKAYKWTDFVHFYDVTKYRWQEMRSKFNVSVKVKIGAKFFLEIVDGSKGRTYVVVRTEPDTHKQVYEALKMYLKEEEYRGKQEVGPKKYLFK